MALKFRTAFFNDALDISNLDILGELINADGLSQTKINTSIHNGSAMAALMNDYQKSNQQSIKGSPTYVINDGRQTLYGNVGYRVLYANLTTLLNTSEDEASWC